MRHEEMCNVPGPHRHRRPTPLEVAEATYDIAVSHPTHCAWRKDIYDGCSCGVTGAAVVLTDLMRERPQI